jgi:hypothetical protein
MNRSTKKWILFFATLALMAGTAGALTWLKTHQELGAPGVQATAIPGQEVKMQLKLPERVLGFTSTNMPEPETVVGYLPKDTSYIGRRYFATNWIWTDAALILMGEDRTSIHRADYCLPGQGWQIREKSVVNLPIAGAQPYELPVSKWVIAQTYTAPDGSQQAISGIYVFWFVTKDQSTYDFPTMLKSMFFHLVRHGVLQRWAYASYFTPCQPGQEDATFARMKALIAASVPEFQLPPDPAK